MAASLAQAQTLTQCITILQHLKELVLFNIRGPSISREGSPEPSHRFVGPPLGLFSFP